MIDHLDVAALIEEGVVAEIFKHVAEKSQAMQLLTRLGNMSSNRTNLRVESELPLAYWQATSTSHKKITKAAWENVYITAEELAVIVPIAEADLRDADFDILAQVQPKIEEAMANLIDTAIFFGNDTDGNKPASFPEGIVVQALKAGHLLAQGSNTFYKAVSDAMGEVEGDGFDVTGLVGGPAVKKYFRDMVDSTGQLIVGDEISALPRAIIRNGAWKSSNKVVVGDFKQAVYSIRQDIEVKLLTEGVIQDPSSKEIVYNLAQQDMVALRVTFRMGWALPNPVNRLDPDKAARLPFAVVANEGGTVNVIFDPAEATTFEDSIDVKLASNVADAKIYYTDDGTTPTSSSTLYTGPIKLTATKTIKAIAIRENYTSGSVGSVTYTKGE